MYCFKFARIFTGKNERLGERAMRLRVRAFKPAARDRRIREPRVTPEYRWNRVVLFAHGGAL